MEQFQKHKFTVASLFIINIDSASQALSFDVSSFVEIYNM